MAQFRAVIRGERGEASRLGGKNTGMYVTCNGWSSGVRIISRHDESIHEDVFDVYMTSGSNGGRNEEHLGSIRGDKFYPRGRISNGKVQGGKRVNITTDAEEA